MVNGDYTNMLKTIDEYGYVIKNGILAFQKGPFSQWYGGYGTQSSSFFYGKMCEAPTQYNCCEQWMMARKAKLFKDYEMHSKILLETSPKKQKALGREIKGYDQGVWDKKKKKIVFFGNLLKFTQNEELFVFLKSTEDLILVEAAPWDKVWGCGTGPEDERTFNEEQWQGENLLGKALMKTRSAINL
jgi:ribA/ribD-fused uncharacterized protein